MRISTNQIQQIGVRSILEQQVTLSKTQQQVATGRRILTPSDDPVATTEMLQLRETINTTEQFQVNANTVINRLSTEEGVLDGITNLFQRVRELTVQAANGSQTNETRRFIAAELRGRLDELVGLANSKDGTGDYMFAGTKASTQPFSANSSGGYDYYGDQTVRTLQIGPGRQVADGNTGADVFQFIKNGNGTFHTEANSANTGTGIIDQGVVNGHYIPSLPDGYTITFTQVLPTDPITYEVTDSDGNAIVAAGAPYVENQPIQFNGASVLIRGTPADGDTFAVKSSVNQDVFQTIKDLIDTLEAPSTTPQQKAMLGNNINRALGDLDQAVGNVLVVRSSVGARLNTIESQQYVNEDYLLQGKQILSSIEDLDYAEAISRLHMEIAGLEAAQQAYLKINGLSMFNFLK